MNLEKILADHEKWMKGEGGECADLSCANLRGANLRGNNLMVNHPPLCDHNFISEILFRESTNLKERSWAGLVRISTDWCWNDFLDNCSNSMIEWAKIILCRKWPEFNKKFEGGGMK